MKEVSIDVTVTYTAGFTIEVKDKFVKKLQKYENVELIGNHTTEEQEEIMDFLQSNVSESDAMDWSFTIDGISER